MATDEYLGPQTHRELRQLEQQLAELRQELAVAQGECQALQLAYEDLEEEHEATVVALAATHELLATTVRGRLDGLREAIDRALPRIETAARNATGLDQVTLGLAASGLRNAAAAGVCRVCGCTDIDCRGCIARTGEPCHWVEDDLCSACAPAAAAAAAEG